MGEIINKVNSTYTYLIHDLGDERTKDLPFMLNPMFVVGLITTYLIFCIYFGPQLMKNRKPFKLKNVIMVYNLIQILLSLYLTWLGLCFLLGKGGDLSCNPATNPNNPLLVMTARHAWLYFFAKLTELMETVFFVLRKKTNQVSTLHLYHHTMVALSAWAICKYIPVIGPVVLTGTLNSFVHAIMYTYYFLAGLGPQYQKYLWWKKHMTLIQLIQFAIIIAHNTSALFQNCGHSKMIHVYIIINTGIVAYMFGKFYFFNYIKPKPKKAVEMKETQEKVTLKTKRKSIRAGE